VSIYIAEELAPLAFLLACIARITGRYYAPSSPRRSAGRSDSSEVTEVYPLLFLTPLIDAICGARYASDRIYIQFSCIRCSRLPLRTASGGRCRDRRRSIAPYFDSSANLQSRSRVHRKRKSAPRTRGEGRLLLRFLYESSLVFGKFST